jgi:hypothetical protein
MAIKQSTTKAPTHPGWDRLPPPHDQVTVRIEAIANGVWNGIVYEAQGLPDDLIRSGAAEANLTEPGRHGRPRRDSRGVYHVSRRDRHRGRWTIMRSIATAAKARGLPGVPSDIEFAEPEAAEPSAPEFDGVPRTAQTWKLQAGHLLESMTDVARDLTENALGRRWVGFTSRWRTLGGSNKSSPTSKRRSRRHTTARRSSIARLRGCAS